MLEFYEFASSQYIKRTVDLMYTYVYIMYTISLEKMQAITHFLLTLICINYIQ